MRRIRCIALDYTLAACVASAVWVSSASATTPAPVTFDHGRNAPTKIDDRSSPGQVASASCPSASCLPIRAGFYYPWFPEAWNQQGINPFTHYTPSLGFYNTSDLATVTSQVQAMQYGGLQAGIASWWGQGSRTDGRVSTLLQAAAPSGFQWALYYEAEGNATGGVPGSPDPTTAQISSDLAYIMTHYASSPNYLHVNGKPVLFVYGDGSDGCATAARWAEANTLGFYLNLKVFPGYASCASQPDSWHQYGPAVAEDSQPGRSFTISPGFYKANETAPRLARDSSTFAQNVRDMAASNAPWQLVTTFNEWGEGTSVESAQEWASSSGYGAYLDLLHSVLGAATPLPTPTPPPPPTANSPTGQRAAALKKCKKKRRQRRKKCRKKATKLPV